MIGRADIEGSKSNVAINAWLPQASYPCGNFSDTSSLVNNPTLAEICFTMIGRADIEGSKSNVAMKAWLPQASYPCGNFSDTSSLKFQKTKGSIGHAFTVCSRTENQNQMMEIQSRIAGGEEKLTTDSAIAACVKQGRSET